MNGHALAFHLLCSLHLIFSIITVVVQFYPWFKFYFLLFLYMVMYDNEFETIEKFKPRIKLNHNITAGKYCPASFRASVWIFLMKLKLQQSLLMQ